MRYAHNLVRGHRRVGDDWDYSMCEGSRRPIAPPTDSKKLEKRIVVKANNKSISSDTHRLQCIELHHFLN